MQGDPWHSDAEGNFLVAQELASIVLDQGLSPAHSHRNACGQLLSLSHSGSE